MSDEFSYLVRRLLFKDVSLGRKHQQFSTGDIINERCVDTPAKHSLPWISSVA